MDAIAPYQGEKKPRRHSFQTWRLIVTPENEGKSRSAALLCGKVKKSIVRQEIDVTDFLLHGFAMLFASREQHQQGKNASSACCPENIEKEVTWKHFVRNAASSCVIL